MKSREEFLTKLDDIAYQNEILQHVSRTFALTIPQLPEPLCTVVGNAYLLCRIADTIEDDKIMSAEQKKQYAERFIDVVKGSDEAESFSGALFPLLSPTATEAEHDLIANTAPVIRITHSFNSRQRAALERCVKIMADGMVIYQDAETLDGVADQVGQHLSQSGWIANQVVLHLITDFYDEVSAFGAGWFSEQGCGLLNDFAEAEGHGFDRHLARLDLGQIKDVVDDAQKRTG